MEQSKCVDIFIKISKILAYLVTFIVVLGAAVVSKGTLLFMTSQIAPNRTLSYCNKELDKHKEFIVTLPRIERVAWIWVIIFSYFVVELLTFLRSLRICLFKTWSMPNVMEVVVLTIIESLPAVGNALFVFCILPELDVIKGVMLANAVCFVPAIAGFVTQNINTQKHFSNDNQNKKWKTIIKHYITKCLDIFSIFAQATGFIVWPLMDNKPQLWIIPASVLMISVGWLENYIPQNLMHNYIQKFTNKKKSDDNNLIGTDDSDIEEDEEYNNYFENSRYFIYLFLSLWKCILFFITSLIIILIQEDSIGFLFEDFVNAYKEHDINVSEIKPIVSTRIGEENEVLIHIGATEVLPASHLTPIWVFIINISTTYVCYAFGKFACKITIQPFSYAFPINLAVPTTVTLLIVFCGIHNADSCAFYSTIPSYLFFNGSPIYDLWDYIGTQQAWIWLLWLLSQAWISIHIWSPNCEKLATTEKLYVKPMYDAFFVDQSLAMNRRREDHSSLNYNLTNDTIIDPDETTRIYACATMWHETKEEMMTFLKSILRLDEDQCARELVKDDLKMNIKDDYYKLETHIFFDDAFIRVHEEDNDPQLNTYVEKLISAVNEVVKEVYPMNVRMKNVKKCVTPYGGRLEWTLPGQTKMIVHLKDKKKIRAKKRWSQVMYMYYLLGYKLMGSDLTPQQKDTRSNHTFLLALDGDIDFQPSALHHLVTLMKRNLKLGAACGRIHPLGSGPMVWFQIFEYSIAHWLQKATEHMIGCVLCSPGCFSLFRAKALMDDNVMAKYTSRSEQPIHFVQYDQGEDRWLCTLLLQRGYRVEYCAASDAYTQCPEKFIEFYNQRRRWMPSTTANILDLLIDYKHVVKMNNNISRIYILYQVILMVGTILGPGTIFLMIVGSFVAAFQMSQWSSFCWNAFPIVLYMAICLWCSSDVQLFFAGLLSAVYGLVMMAVLVGIMLQISVDGPLAPTSLFLFGVAGQLIITALFHPKEASNLVYGIIYYVAIPSMYLILVIYSIFNLNDISWGTRDVTLVAPKPMEESDKATNNTATNTKQKTVINIFGSDEVKKKTGSLEFSLAGLFTLMLCTHPKEPEQNDDLKKICESINKVSNRLDEIEDLIHGIPKKTLQDKASLEPAKVNEQQANPKFTGVIKGESGVVQGESKVLLVDSPNSWLNVKAVSNGERSYITRSEKNFWAALVGDMLKPYKDDKDQLSKDLKDLRDKAVAAFIMLNFIFVLVVFILTLKKDQLHFQWPFNVKVNFTYIDNTREIKVYKEYLQLEPIGFLFLTFFATLLCTQFIAMFFHRFGTFQQFLASTSINWGYFTKLKKKTISPDKILEDNPLSVVKMLLKTTQNKEPTVDRRKTVKYRALDYEEEGDNEVYDLKEAFLKNNNSSEARKSMMIAYEKRRNTYAAQYHPNNSTKTTYTNHAFQPDF